MGASERTRLRHTTPASDVTPRADANSDLPRGVPQAGARLRRRARLLELLGNADGSPADDIAKRAGNSLGTVRTDLRHLAAHGYVVRLPDGGYRRAARAVLAAGPVTAPERRFVASLGAVAARIACDLGDPVLLSQRCGGRLVVIANVPARRAVPDALRVGAELPVSGTAIGRAWSAAEALEDEDDDESREILRAAGLGYGFAIGGVDPDWGAVACALRMPPTPLGLGETIVISTGGNADRYAQREQGLAGRLREAINAHGLELAR